MRYIKTLSYLTTILLLVSCDSDKPGASDEMQPLYPAPLTVALNTREGYIINPVTGDSVGLILNFNRDTIKTGVPVPAIGKTIHPDSVAQPKIIPAGKPKVIRTQLNVHKIPENLTVIPVNKDSLKTFTPGVDTSSFVLVNSFGDTVPTGVPIPIKGKVVPCLQPKPVKALPPRMKDNASINMKYLDMEQGMNSSYVRSILEDSHGNLWFGTNKGVSIYSGETFTHFTEKEGLSDNYVGSILEDRHGNLWFGTDGGGVSMFNGDTFTHFTEDEGLCSNYISSILEDRHGNLWFGTWSGGASKYDGETFTHFTEKEGLSSTIVSSILEDSNGNLWFGTSEGVSKYDGETFTHFTEKEGLSNNRVRSILEDNQGNLWFGTYFGGVSMYDGKTFTHFTEKEGLSNNNVGAILEDRHGKLWFGTEGGGVSMYNGETFTHFSEKEGLSDNYIRSILEDSNGNLWFCSSNGVTQYNSESFTHYTVKEGLSSNYIGSILEDCYGNLWFCGSNGVTQYNGESFTHFTEKEGIFLYGVDCSLEDCHGNIWFGTWGVGVSMYNGETFTHFTEKEGLSNDYVNSILEDRHGNLWFGTDGGGATVYSGDTFTHFTEKEGLSSNYVKSILEDSNSNIWLSTERGLNLLMFSPDSVSKEKNSLTVPGLKEDSVKVKFNNPTIHTYDKQDGLDGMEFNPNSMLLDSKNRLWWGTTKGLTMLNMNNFIIPVEPPTMQLNWVEINEQFIDYRHLKESAGMEMKFDDVAKFNNYPLNLELPYNSNHLTFHFSAIGWSAPHKIRYSYKMEGLNDNWSLPTADAKADYRNLPYGTHTFKLRAIGAAQKWSETFEYTFNIHPPWWHTWWARTGYAFTALLLIIGIVRWRTAKLKQRQKELEQTVKDRTVEISDKNEELSQQNEEISSQRDLLANQKDQILEQKQATTDSIQYARRIQQAVLPPNEVLKYLLPKHFILYKPRDIVSGDFYWLAQKEDKIILVVADCTGHGVPGAFMSMLGSALLNDIVNNIEVLQANLILDELRDQVMRSLRQTGREGEAKDGMDIALCIFDKKTMKLQFAGGYNPLYLIRNKELTEIKADKMPIGISSKAGESFTNHELTLQKGDAFYMFSDGYVDQFGGPKGKKYMLARFKQLLLDIQNKIMFEQKEILEQTLNDWMGTDGQHKEEYEQIDDIIVMGIKI